MAYLNQVKLETNLEELEQMRRFSCQERRFILGFSAGTNAAMEIIIYNAHFCNNFLLVSPYFMKRPGVSERERVPFNHFRAGHLCNSLKENDSIRMLIMNPDKDCYREVAVCLSFWLRGQMKERVVVTDEPGEHNQPLLELFGSGNRSKLLDFIIQQDNELQNIRNYTPTPIPPFYQ